MVSALRLRPQGEPETQVASGVEMEGTLREARDRFEKTFILRRLHEAHWNITRAADRLGIERSNLHRKIKSYGIETPED